MRWFRTNRFLGAQAALFALLVQFTVAFGHVHAGKGGESTYLPAASALNVVQDDLNAPAPADHRQDPADGACVICATVHLTGSAQIATSPALPYPVTYRMATLSLSSEVALDDPRYFDHRSRGPPQG